VAARKLRYAQAINEALDQMMQEDDTVLLVGQGINSPWSVGTSTLGLSEKFGTKRVFDPPIAENAITGVCVGAAMAGFRPVLVHPRMDFMYLAMDQIINHAANWHYMFAGKVKVPLTIRAIINRGNEQGPQHSQSLQAMFMHVPGLKVVMPATPYDAKGLLIAAIQDDNPVVYIDDRWLYDVEGEVPQEVYTVPIGRAEVRCQGRDVTVVATSYMVPLACHEEPNAEVIDLSSLRPLFGRRQILQSYERTGQIEIWEPDWVYCGVSAEIAARVAESILHVRRRGFVDCPTPTSWALESQYYGTEGLPGECIPGRVEGPF